MQRVPSYCKERKAVIHGQLNAAVNTEEQYTKGLIALLLQRLEDVKLDDCKAKVCIYQGRCHVFSRDLDTSEDSSHTSVECDHFRIHMYSKLKL